MPRPKAAMGGSMKMGGAGKKPGAPPTIMSGLGPTPKKPAAAPPPPKVGGGSPFGASAPPSPMGTRAAPGAGPAAPGGAAFACGGKVMKHAKGGPIGNPFGKEPKGDEKEPARPGKKERAEERAEKVAMHEKGGPITPPSKQETAKHHVETAVHHAKERVAMHAHGGPVIAGHSTHGHGFGTSGSEHPKEQGISKGSDGRRGGVKGGGLERISSTTADSKPRISTHKKGT